MVVGSHVIARGGLGVGKLLRGSVVGKVEDEVEIVGKHDDFAIPL